MIFHITLDIETIPCQRQDVRDYIATTVKPPATFKKAESIAEWYREQGPAAIEAEVNQTSLSGTFGQVVCVGIAFGDDAPYSLSGLNECDVLDALNSAMDLVPQKDWYSTCIVGHNVSAFDLRFLVQRYMVNGIKPHQIIARAAQAKPWETDKVYDTMIQFAGAGQRISLDKLCLALSLERKGDISGADVWPMVQAGRLAEVAAYCEHDVKITRDVFCCMTFSPLVTGTEFVNLPKAAQAPFEPAMALEEIDF